MRNRQLQHLTLPATGERFSQSRIHSRRRSGFDKSDSLLKIDLEAIGRIRDP